MRRAQQSERSWFDFNPNAESFITELHDEVVAWRGHPHTESSLSRIAARETVLSDDVASSAAQGRDRAQTLSRIQRDRAALLRSPVAAVRRFGQELRQLQADQRAGREVDFIAHASNLLDRADAAENAGEIGSVEHLRIADDLTVLHQTSGQRTDHDQTMAIRPFPAPFSVDPAVLGSSVPGLDLLDQES